MSDFTYESGVPVTPLETFEWDNVWWDNAPDKNKKRALYIGDSISCAIRREATLATEEQLLFDGFGTSKAVDHPFFERSVSLFAEQQGKREVILFNNGLHGWHLDDEKEYPEYYEKLVRFLQKELSAPVVIVLTTRVSDPERIKRVIKRNKAALDIAERTGCKVIDLFSASEQFAEYQAADGVHYIPEGCCLLAEFLVKELKKLYPEL